MTTTTTTKTKNADGGTTTTTTTKWGTIQLAIRLGSVLVLTIAVIGILCLSGKDISVEQILLVVMAGAALAGLTVTRPNGGGGGAAAAGGLLLVISTLAGGCACFQAAQALSMVESAEDVAEVMPLIMECSEEAAQVLGQCRAVEGGNADLTTLLPPATVVTREAPGILPRPAELGGEPAELPPWTPGDPEPE